MYCEQNDSAKLMNHSLTIQMKQQAHILHLLNEGDDASCGNFSSSNMWEEGSATVADVTLLRVRGDCALVQGVVFSPATSSVSLT